MTKKNVETDIKRLENLLTSEEGKVLIKTLEQYYKTLSECYPELSIDFQINDTVDIIHKLLRLIARDYELEQEEKKNKEEE